MGGVARSLGVTAQHLQRTIGNQATQAFLQRMFRPSASEPAAVVRAKLTVGPPDDIYEREADAAASRVMTGQPVQKISRLPARGLPQRQEAKASGPTVKDVLRLDQTVPIKGLPAKQPNYVDRAIGRIQSAPLGPDITLIPRTDATGQNGIPILKGDFHLDKDPLSGPAIAQNQVYPSREVAEAVVADLDRLTPDTPNYAYYLKGGIIFPTILSDTTLPNLMPVIRQKREQDLRDLKATGDLAEAVLWWYVGARFPIKVGRGPGAAPVKEAAKGGVAAKVAFDAAKVADEMFAATKSIANPGQRMLAAGRQLATIGGLAAAQKVQVMQEFFKRIGFVISKAGVVDDGARFLMYSEDSRYAFAFVKDTGEILYGKFNMKAMEYVWEVLK